MRFSYQCAETSLVDLTESIAYFQAPLALLDLLGLIMSPCNALEDIGLMDQRDSPALVRRPFGKRFFACQRVTTGPWPHPIYPRRG